MAAPLLGPDDLTAALTPRTLDPIRADNATRRASGWLQDATRLDTWPSPVPDDLWAWALELAVIAYDNPGGKSMEVAGPFTSTWGARRAEILAVARRRYGSDGKPVGYFPAAVPWPDPAWPCR